MGDPADTEGVRAFNVPGDKSISHRALLLGALADGTSRVRGVLDSADLRSTREVLSALGVAIPPLDGGAVELHIEGRGLRGLAAPGRALDCGNSGTTARLLTGVLAGQGFESILTGDGSLRRRPMGRVTEPLGRMGAGFAWLEDEGRLPMVVRGAALRPMEYDSPVASAQVKSALLLAGLVAGVSVVVSEPRRSRDHTERMFEGLGAPTTSHVVGERWQVELSDPPDRLAPLDLEIPGDFSSAAFLLVAALLSEDPRPLLVRGVGVNPTRTGLLGVLGRMGAQVSVLNERQSGGEPVADLLVEPAELSACEIGGDEVPSLIDEIPVLVVAAARAHGVTRIRGAEELRVKESDRLHALVSNLRAVGVQVKEYADGLDVEGSDAPLTGVIDAMHDHRIAMAFGVLDTAPGCSIEVSGKETAEVSFPGFWRTVAEAGAHRQHGSPLRRARGAGEAAVARPPLVTIDGPAGSGKSTTAREVARRLGFRHLDSGALYRALTLATLESGVPETEWSDLDDHTVDGFGLSLRSVPGGFELLRHGIPIPPEHLRSPMITASVSAVARVPAVRRRLLGLQRAAGKDGGLVTDGRDMGTVVFPDAEVKIFLLADVRARARRRIAEGGGDPNDAERVAAEVNLISLRDAADSERAISPLRKPEGAEVIDTTQSTFEQQVENVLACVDRVWRPRSGPFPQAPQKVDPSTPDP